MEGQNSVGFELGLASRFGIKVGFRFGVRLGVGIRVGVRVNCEQLRIHVDVTVHVFFPIISPLPSFIKSNSVYKLNGWGV